jgi:hypothetical protein
MGAMAYPETIPHVLPEHITDEQVEAITAGKMLEVEALTFPRKHSEEGAFA